MTDRQEKAGTGLTAYEVTIHDRSMTPEDFGNMFKGFEPTFEYRTRWMRGFCQHVLDNEERYDLIKDDPALQYSDDRPSNLAHQALNFMKAAQAYANEGKADLAARYAFNAGDITCKLLMKVSHESDYLRGYRNAEVLNEARDNANRRKQENRKPQWTAWRSEAAKVWEASPGLSTSAVAKIVKSRLSLQEKIDTISRRLEKPRTPH